MKVVGRSLVTSKARRTPATPFRCLTVCSRSNTWSDRRELLAAMRARLIYVGEFIAEQARLGDPGMKRLVEWDTPRSMFEDDIGYLEDHRETLEGALH